METITNINDIRIGDIVKHAGRKTLMFKVTERKGSSIIINRVDRAGFKGYRVGPSDVAKGYITLIKKGSEADELATLGSQKETKAPVEETTERKLTIAQLRNNQFLYSQNIVDELAILESQLSPENLAMDGEATPRMIRIRRAKINDKIALLERYLGVKVAIQG